VIKPPGLRDAIASEIDQARKAFAVR
jgi:hypothetical protein